MSGPDPFPEPSVLALEFGRPGWDEMQSAAGAKVTVNFENVDQEAAGWKGQSAAFVDDEPREVR